MGTRQKLKGKNMEIIGVRWLNGHAGGEVESSLGLEVVMRASMAESQTQNKVSRR
jgi:hypothetical protein